MDKHTPGPWARDKYGSVITPSGRSLLVTGIALTTGNHPDEPEVEANTNLIAAAPDMLDALRTAERLLSEMFKQSPTLTAVRAAIAKAEGR